MVPFAASLRTAPTSRIPVSNSGKLLISDSDTETPGSTQTSEIPSDVAQVRPLLLQDHAEAVTDAGMPVTAAPRVLAFLREQLRRGRGQEVGHHPLSLGAHREDLLVGRLVRAEDRHVEAHLGGTGEDLADLVERLRLPHDPAAQPS